MSPADLKAARKFRSKYPGAAGIVDFVRLNPLDLVVHQLWISTAIAESHRDKVTPDKWLHTALLDPPSADVSGRCLGFLAQLGYTPDHPTVAAALAYLRREQESDGSWFGRWGTNYIYGTWTALCALNAAGLPLADSRIQRAANWLISIQNADGGWGEGGESYKLDYRGYEAAPSTASQTSWAVLGLMAAGFVDHPAVAKGVQYLHSTQREHGLWDETRFTATGFPRVFYLRYHGYRKFFPLWALARYRNMMRDGASRVTAAM